MNSKDITIVLTTCARSASMNRKFLSPMPFDFSTPHRRFLASPGFLCVSYHATTQMHKIGLPAQPQNCGVWKTVSLMLAGAYQSVAQRAPRCSNWQLFFSDCFLCFYFCSIHNKSFLGTLKKTFQDGSQRSQRHLQRLQMWRTILWRIDPDVWWHEARWLSSSIEVGGTILPHGGNAAKKWQLVLCKRCLTLWCFSFGKYHLFFFGNLNRAPPTETPRETS